MTAEQDLHTRWTPSPAQDAEAARALRAWEKDSVCTAHLLLNKEEGVWTADVEILPLNSVYMDRGQALSAVDAAMEIYRMHNPGKAVSGGYARHQLPWDGETPRTADGRTWQTVWTVFEA